LPEGDLATPVKSVANTPDCILDTPRKHDDGPALQNTQIPQNSHKTDQTWYHPTSNTTPKPQRDVYSYFLNSDYSDEYYSDDGYSRDTMDNVYRHYLKSDYNDDYYSDDGNSGDPDVDNMYRHFLKSDYSDEYYSDDYTDTI
jgi:hypothetical protein